MHNVINKANKWKAQDLTWLSISCSIDAPPQLKWIFILSCFGSVAVMAGISNYAVRMARLSAQIFGEVVRPTDSKSLKVVKLFQEPPMAKRKEVYDWYPQHKIYYAMTQKLRFMGLFRYSRSHDIATAFIPSAVFSSVCHFVLIAVEQLSMKS